MTTMTVAPWTDGLRALGACADAIVWAETQPDLATAWAECERGDWMLWLAGRCSGDPGSASRKQVVLAACASRCRGMRRAIRMTDVRTRRSRPRRHGRGASPA